MTTVTLKFVNPAAAGKKFGSVVTVENVKYLVGRGLVDRFEKGRTYDVTLEEQNWDGKPVTLITALDSVRTPQNAPQHAAEVADRVRGQPGNGGSTDRFYLPFVSNTVAHAIQAGLIKSPSELNQWAKSAYEAAQALDIL